MTAVPPPGWPARLLAAVAFDEPSSAALRRAVTLGEALGATVTALHVAALADPGREAQAALVGVPPGRHRGEDLAGAVADLDALVTRAVGSTHVRQALRFGLDPAAAVLDAVDQLGADLLIVGTRGRGGALRALVGSVAERILRGAPVPAIAVPPGALVAAGRPVRRIVAATDFSPAADAAVSHAAALAARLGARLTLVHAGPDAAERLPELRRWHAAPRIRVGVVARPGRDIAHEILGVVARLRADLLALGLHGLGGARRVLGGVAESLVRHAPVPVLTVRADV